MIVHCQCGKKIEAKHSNKKYCDECLKARRVKQVMESQKRKNKVIKLICPVCKTEFIYSRDHKSYCSEECREKAKYDKKYISEKITAKKEMALSDFSKNLIAARQAGLSYGKYMASKHGMIATSV